MKPTYKTTLITLAPSSEEGQAKLDIPSGAKVYVGASQVGGDSDVMLRLQVEENGSTIHDAMNTAWYNGNNGSFRQRAIDLGDYQGGSQLTLRVLTTEPLRSKAVVEVVFEITKEGQSC